MKAGSDTFYYYRDTGMQNALGIATKNRFAYLCLDDIKMY